MPGTPWGTPLSSSEQAHWGSEPAPIPSQTQRGTQSPSMTPHPPNIWTQRPPALVTCPTLCAHHPAETPTGRCTQAPTTPRAPPCRRSRGTPTPGTLDCYTSQMHMSPVETVGTVPWSCAVHSLNSCPWQPPQELTPQQTASPPDNGHSTELSGAYTSTHGVEGSGLCPTPLLLQGWEVPLTHGWTTVASREAHLAPTPAGLASDPGEA